MTDGNRKKNEQLKMSYGKANNILRKSILFQLLIDSGKNICYRCNKEIEWINELSIEHKIPWLDSEDPERLFFDLGNISFSHLKCNCQHSRFPNKIDYPEGQKWCWKCKSFKNIEKFPNCAKHRRTQECTECLKIRQREYRNRK